MRYKQDQDMAQVEDVDVRTYKGVINNFQAQIVSEADVWEKTELFYDLNYPQSYDVSRG